jgi:hypothetical protein
MEKRVFWFWFLPKTDRGKQFSLRAAFFAEEHVYSFIFPISWSTYKNPVFERNPLCSDFAICTFFAEFLLSASWFSDSGFVSIRAVVSCPIRLVSFPVNP